MTESRRPMPSFEKSSPALVARFEAVAARHPEARRKPMFGYPALFVGGTALAQVWMYLVVPTIAGAVAGWLIKSKTLDF